MKIFHFDPHLGELVGEGFADESPLEPGVWLVPANATGVIPPAPQEGKTLNFVGGAWVHQDIPPPPEPEPDIPPTPLEQIVSLEREQLMPRATREFMLLAMEAQFTAEQLVLNPGYQAVKLFDDTIADLRAQIPND